MPNLSYSPHFFSPHVLNVYLSPVSPFCSQCLLVSHVSLFPISHCCTLSHCFFCLTIPYLSLFPMFYHSLCLISPWAPLNLVSYCSPFLIVTYFMFTTSHSLHISLFLLSHLFSISQCHFFPGFIIRYPSLLPVFH